MIWGRNGHRIDLLSHLSQHLAKVGVFGGLGIPLCHLSEFSSVDITQANNLATTFGRIHRIAPAFTSHSNAGNLYLGIQILTA
ncbi:hypothetical protein N8488_02820 [Akkermansiaceae bacterium]|nr:hypothetical protein [Akkermansiaceae bacterium]